MTPDPTPSPAPGNDTWDSILDNLRRRFPGAKDGILFCVHKLQFDPNLKLADIRAEAALHRLSLGGRSLHSAKVFLGMEKPAVRRSKAVIAADDEQQQRPARAERRANGGQVESGSIEDKVILAVRQIQNAALSQTQRLRRAITEALAILQAAIDDD
ncbi:MAG TPA: hypothetical protein VK348_10100 [Planctomycetota bacterium]|nr:hypothetical protein [Planctomycetota bacterium]